MTLAQQLAEAIHNAQAKLTRVADSARDELVKQRDELQRLSRLPVDEQTLAKQITDATGATETLRRDVKRLESERSDVKSKLDRQLREVYERLGEIHNSKSAEIRVAAVTTDLHQAMLAFAGELERMGLPGDRAPLAQQVTQIPALARFATGMRLRLVKEARSASLVLESRTELSKKYGSLVDEDRKLRLEWAEWWKRLQQHYRVLETGILDDMETLDGRLARRLRQEILVPKLNDARIEREKGLVGIDPLKEIESLE